LLSADEKLYNLCNNDVTRNLRAVQNRRFITIPFSATTLGVRIGSLAFNLAEASTALVQNGGLSSVQFTEVSLSDEATSALGSSGAIVYTRLPIVNNVDLESFCPGGQSNIFITADSDSDAEPAVAEPPVVAEPVVEEEDSHDSHDHGDEEEEHDHEPEMMKEDDSSASRFSVVGALAIAAATIAALVY
jgi:hypothetical protein